MGFEDAGVFWKTFYLANGEENRCGAIEITGKT